MSDAAAPRPLADWTTHGAFGIDPARVDPVLVDLASTALEAARAATAVLTTAEVTGVDTKISPTDMVSDVDRRSEAEVNRVLGSRRPDDAVLGEEGTTTGGTSGVRWVVDPLDGTTNFLFGLPQFSVSIAAEMDSSAVVGVVMDPSRQEVWAAVTGHGSYRNGQRCEVPDGRSTLATALCATGFGYRPDRRVWQAGVLARLIGQIRDVRRLGSAALDLCWTAGGRYDAYFEWGLNPWDLSAGSLIAAEAGACVAQVGNRLVVAAPPSLFGPLCDLLERSGGFDAPAGPEPDTA